MKLLRIHAKGIPLFKEDFDLCFLATQRVSEDEKNSLYSLFSNIYINPTEVIMGINASGKTSTLKIVLLALNLINNEPINHIEVKDILGKSKKVILTTYFYTNNKEVCKLETVISSKEEEIDSYIITSEKLWKKSNAIVKAKKAIFNFDDSMLVAERNDTEEFLSDDVSIIIAQNKKNKEHITITNLLSFTNINILPNTEIIPTSVIKFLDPTIEKLYFENNSKNNVIHLKFFNQDEFVLNNARELENYLSSGTIKGIITFTKAMNILKHGGYMVIDEIENHFNKEIVMTLIRFFTDVRLNKNGAILIFTTHYPELLDEYDRNDSIFITRNKGGITVENLSNILTRNDIKKSDAYQSGFIDGTTPAYEAYIQLKKSISTYI